MPKPQRLWLNYLLMCTKVTTNCENESSSALLLDTLAQSGTNSEDFAFDLVSQTSKNDKRNLKKRARRKYFTNNLITSLVDAARQNEKSGLKKSYWNSFHCAASLTEDNTGKITGRYCKCRWCMVCNSIRTAQLIRQYRPVFDTWNDVHFVTLTVPNISAYTLPGMLGAMQEAFKRIHERYKKQHQRGQSDRFKGFRKIECTYNPERNDFHPHYHVFVEGKEMAERLKDDWLREFSIAAQEGQDVRPADESALMELFKYTTKVISGKPGVGDGRKIYADAMDIIFNAMRRKRTFQPFGFEKSDREIMAEVTAELEAEATEVTKEQVFAVAEWTFEDADWVNRETGETLADYEPGEGMRDLCENRIVFRVGHDWTPKKYDFDDKLSKSKIRPQKRSPRVQKPLDHGVISPGIAAGVRRRAGLESLKDREILIIPF